MYDYITLTQTNIDGSISPFPNGASGLILLGTGTSIPPAWKTLAEAGIAALSGAAFTGAITGTSASFSSTVTATGGFSGDLSGTATKVGHSLSIQLGTNTPQSYDGSAAVSLQVTPTAIGAALASHEHALTDITSAWPTAGLMVSNGTTVQPTSIAWPSGTNSDGAYLLLHYKNGTFTDTWEKFAGISSGAGILHWTGTATGATLNLLQTEHEGYVLARTSNGYEFISLGSATVPPITSLQIGSSGLTNAHQFLSKNGTNVTSDTNPIWSVLTNAHIYVNANAAASTGPSVLVNDNGYATARWLGCSNGGGTGPLFIGVLPNDDVSALQLSDYALTTSTKITDIPSGTNSTASKILLGGANANTAPTWAAITSVPTGLNAGIAKIDSNGKLTSGSVSLGGSEVSGTLGVGNGGTGKSSLTAYALLAGGTTSTGNLQQVSTGTAGQVLTSNGNGALPSFQTLTIPTAPTNLPLVDNETGALGTAGTYANADHQHPLPYAVQAAYKFFYPRKIGIGGAITAEAQEYDGTADLILQATEIDPAAIINTVPIEKGGTGASTASQALTNLGAAASNHNHDGTYLKLSGGSSQAMTGALYFNSALSTAIVAPGMSEGVATVGSNGAFSSASSVNSYVTGRRNNINLYDSGVSSDSTSPTDINHIAKNDTTVNIVCGSSATRAYTRYINLPTPTYDMLGDTITIYFTNQKAAVTGTIWATCATDERIMDYRYEHFKNAETTGWKNCSWSSGNVVQFTCIKLDSTGNTYYWRAVKLAEQSW